ncbi:MAG TPA: hypothetical protein VL460_10325 [Caulobacteraceae bacterium]|jgi:hypothetical protein|nr:hypothetical protein [Caulobacteraceae bacterium]
MPSSTDTLWRWTALGFGAALACAAPAQAAPAAAMPAFAALPDWTGVWQGTGTLFDQSRGVLSPETGSSRDYPPYKPDWEARYEAFLKDVVWAERFVDPITLCYPAGFPRLASVPFGINFVVRPEATWIVYERGAVRFIFTDGRPHPGEDDLWPTWEGHSIGHWEGDTLVVDTVGLRAGVPVDRTGLVFSDKLHVAERIHKVGAQLVDEMTLTDPEALTGPWKVTRRYNRSKERFAAIGAIACAESQRNPIVDGKNTVTLGSERADTGSLYPAEIMPFAVPYGMKK